jgi:hypothetical protein
MEYILFIIIVVISIYYIKWTEKHMIKLWYIIDLKKRINKIKKIKGNINGN